MTDWTIEELALLEIYDLGSRISTQSAIEHILPYLVDDPDMEQTAESVLMKLDGISDMDYMLMMLDLDPFTDEWEEAYE